MLNQKGNLIANRKIEYQIGEVILRVNCYKDVVVLNLSLGVSRK
jgi:hypothetical protein